MLLDTPGASESNDLPVIREDTEDEIGTTDSGNTEEPLVETAVTPEHPFGTLDMKHTASP